jgi:acyl-CoA thioesterase-2
MSDPSRIGDAATATDLATVLDLEQLDRDLFRGINAGHSRGHPVLYGGQVAAQALRAAGLTVPGDRFPHSLHGYFLRRGRTDLPVLLHVRRDRDGGSFSARDVSAVQDGEVIFSMVASFHVDEAGGTYEDELSDTPPSPEELPSRPFPSLMEVREITTGDLAADPPRFSDRMWVRSADPLPEDRLVHACALTYMSDLGSGFGQVHRPGIGLGGPSIDHSIWFQRPVRADDWIELHLRPLKAGGMRGLYSGTMRDRDGNLAAVLTQEMLLRRPHV